MGYTTNFSGKLTITPPLDMTQVETINLFCDERHGGNTRPSDGMPGFWCNWQTDGLKLYWNGNEKSYDMSEWLVLLIKKFFIPWGRTLNGKMLAEGEDKDDRWILEVRDNAISTTKLDLLKDLGITE